MGLERNDKDPHRAIESKPKLILAGRLDGLFGGRPVSLIAENRDLILVVSNLRAVLALRRCWRIIVKPFLAVLKTTDIRFSVRISGLGRVEVSPRPQFFVRLMLPH